MSKVYVVYDNESNHVMDTFESMEELLGYKGADYLDNTPFNEHVVTSYTDVKALQQVYIDTPHVYHALDRIKFDD